MMRYKIQYLALQLFARREPFRSAFKETLFIQSGLSRHRQLFRSLQSEVMSNNIPKDRSASPDLSLSGSSRSKTPPPVLKYKTMKPIGGGPAPELPHELMFKVFSLLAPEDLLGCAQVRSQPLP